MRYTSILKIPEAYLQHQKLFLICEQLYKLSYDSYARIGEKWKDLNKWNKYKAFLVLLSARNLSAFHGLVNLCSEGQKLNAQCLSRVIVESFIILKFVQTDRENLSDKFIHYGPIRIKRFFENINEKNPIVTPLLEELKAIYPNWKDSYNEVKDKYPDEKHWAGKGMTIEQIAIKAGVHDIYNSFYRMLANTFHPSTTSLSNHLLQTPDGFAIALDDDVDTIGATLSSGFVFFYEIANEVQNEFGTEQEREFQQILRDFLLVRDSLSQTKPS